MAVNLHALGYSDYPVAYELYVAKNGVEGEPIAGSLTASSPDAGDLPGCGVCLADTYTVAYP